jgi:high affinity Mn2+ porin
MRTPLALMVSRADGGTSTPGGASRSAQHSDWTGSYVGGHLGCAWDVSAFRAQGAGETMEGAFDLFRAFAAFKGTGSYFGGVQNGANYRLPSGVVLGIEADLSAPNTS